MTAMHPVTHRLVGHPIQVANVLYAARQRGHLIECGEPESLSGYRVAITVTLLEPVRDSRPAGPRIVRPRTADPRRPRPGNTRRVDQRAARQQRARRWLRYAVIVAVALAGTAALAGLLWLTVLVVLWVNDHWTQLGCLAIVLALAFGAAQENRR